MLLRKTDINERRERLENIEDSEIFLYDKETSGIAFRVKTVATLLQNKHATHALLIFEDSVPLARAERIVKKIGRTLERFNRVVEIDIYFQVAPELMDIIREECNREGF